MHTREDFGNLEDGLEWSSVCDSNDTYEDSNYKVRMHVNQRGEKMSWISSLMWKGVLKINIGILAGKHIRFVWCHMESYVVAVCITCYYKFSPNVSKLDASASFGWQVDHVFEVLVSAGL